MKYAFTFTPGVNELVVRECKKQPLSKLHITHEEDGLIVCDTTLPPSWFSDLRFTYSAFLVLAEVTDSASLDAMKLALRPGVLTKAIQSFFPACETLQLRAMDAGTPATLGASQRQDIERFVQHAGLQLTSHRPDIELWLLRRASGYGVWALRLPRPRFKREARPAGELRPELAHILGMVANVTGRDVVLDPFAGHGAIPRELIAGFSPRRVIAIEQNPRLAGKLQALARQKPSLTALSGDALLMTAVKNESITRIVTDPPWGEYKPVVGSIESFYAQMCTQFVRVLQAGGIAVVLSSAKDAVAAATATHAALEIVKTYDILVSGKKASIIKLRKTVAGKGKNS